MELNWGKLRQDPYVPTAAVPRVKGRTCPVDESLGWEMSLRGPGVGTAEERNQSRGSLQVDAEGEQSILGKASSHSTGKQRQGDLPADQDQPGTQLWCPGPMPTSRVKYRGQKSHS